jgi:hypothetical protein
MQQDQDEPDGYVIRHRRATDTLWFGPFTTQAEVLQFLQANPSVTPVVIPCYKTVDWNRIG